jgi:hypothetical protein
MALKETFKHMRDLLCQITQDLEKADNGNKAASQRVRTGTVRLEKVAKLYRKESIKSEKATKGQRKPARKASVSHAKVSASRSTAGKASAKAKAKPKALKATAKPHAMSLRKPTAKLPFKKSSSR